MIFHKPCQIVTHTYMRTALALFYQQKNIAEIENILNKEFANVCEWFVDNKMSIHFGENKTKCILFSKEKNLLGKSMTYENNRIKQYLGCYLDTYLSGEPMAMKSLKKDQCKATVLI